MPGMADTIKLILWLLLLCSCSSLGFGSHLDVQCLKDVLKSVADPTGLLKSSWNFDNSSEGSICRFIGVECWHTYESRVLSLRLSNLSLGGEFPRGLENCNTMASLDLSSNEFSGPLPSDVSRQLRFVTSLDLSNNRFSGEIPVGITNMTYLNALNLQHNQFRGQIPWQFDVSSRLASFSVADNKLSGPVPLILGERFPSSSFAGNRELCGKPLDACKKKWRLPRINDASSIGAAAGFVVGFVVAFYFPRLFVCSPRLRPYVVQIV